MNSQYKRNIKREQKAYKRVCSLLALCCDYFND